MEKQYNSIEDFLEDDDFRDWVLKEKSNRLNIYWSKWIKENPDQEATFFQAKSLFEKLNKDIDSWDEKRKEQIFKKIKQEIVRDQAEDGIIPLYSKSVKRSKFKNWYKIAIVGLLLLSFSIAFFNSTYFETKQKSIAQIDEWIIKTNDFGQKSKVYLPDGSSVTLNADSKLKYNKSGFGISHRELFLEGEGFFEVFKNKKTPFKVRSNSLVTTALGTSFNIKAYPLENIKVQLATGIVKVERLEKESVVDEILLNPGQEALLNNSNQLIKQVTENPKTYLWKDGIVFFHKTQFNDAVTTLERWYGVNIKIRGLDDRTILINGEFQKESLKNVLETMKYSLGFDYSISHQNIEIIFKKKVK